MRARRKLDVGSLLREAAQGGGVRGGWRRSYLGATAEVVTVLFVETDRERRRLQRWWRSAEAEASYVAGRGGIPPAPPGPTVRPD